MTHAGKHKQNLNFLIITPEVRAAKQYPAEATHLIEWTCPACGQRNGPHLFFGVSDRFLCPGCEEITLIRPPAQVADAVLQQ